MQYLFYPPRDTDQSSGQPVLRKRTKKRESPVEKASYSRDLLKYEYIQLIIISGIIIWV